MRASAACGENLGGGLGSKRKKILVVDDEPSVLEGIGLLLSSAGYDAKLVASGEEAVRAAENENFDLVLMDLILPGMDGKATCEKIKAIRPFIHVIAISGSPTGGRMEELVKSGDVDFCLYKPFGKDKLLDGVNKILFPC